jgi:hypothetical protein
MVDIYIPVAECGYVPFLGINGKHICKERNFYNLFRHNKEAGVAQSV